MTDRTVKVSLILQAQGYMQGMGEVSKRTSETGTQMEKLAQQRETFNTLGVAALGFGAALGAGVAIAVSKFAEFDQQMSYVEAATHETAGNMDLLRDAALDAGASTVFSATEAAQAIEELSKAGVKTADILSGALAGSMDLAAAGGLSVARAAEITSTALNQFELDGSEASHVADLLAAGAGKAMGSVDDLAQGLKFVGPVANAMGVSLEETTGVMAMFAQQGIIGEQAGTSLRGVLASLTSPSAQARKEIERLGITLYDSQGNFLGLQNAAGELSQAYSTMDGASRDASLGVIFGRETVTAATALYKAGAGGVQEWTDAVDDSGYAAETAAMRLNNLKGDWEALSGALDTAFITMGEGADGPLRGLVQGLTGLVDGFNDLPDGAKQAVLWVGLVTAGVALTGGAALFAIPKIAAFQVGLQTLGITAAGARAGLSRAASFLGGPWGVAIVAATALMATYNRVMEEGVPSQEAIANKISSTADASDKLSAAIQKNKFVPQIDENTRGLLEDLPSLLDQASEASDNWFVGLMKSSTASDNAFDALDRYGDALADLAASDLPAASAAFGELVREYELTDKQALQLLDQMPDLKDAFIKAGDGTDLAADSQALLNVAMGEGTEVAKTSADVYLEQADAVGSLHDQFIELIDAIDEANGKNRDAVTANIDYQETLRAVDEQIANIANGTEGFARGLDIATESGSANKEMLVQLSQNAWDAAAAQLELDGDTAAFTTTLEAQRQKLYDAAIAMGASETEAAYLRDTLLAMPDSKTIQVLAETSWAQSKIGALWNSLNDLAGRTWNIPVQTTVVGQGTVLKPGSQAGDMFNHSVTGFATGGFPSGIYAGTSGSIHKFAEPWLPWETYISGDPGRRERNVGIWEETGRKLGVWQQGSASASPLIQVAAPSLDGMSITGSLDLGNGLIGFVDGRIRKASAGNRVALENGNRG